MALRIGMVAPISHSFPPAGYGPWERVAFDLTEALVAAGHDVTVFAPEGSQTSARLEATVPAPLSDSELDPRLAEEEHLAAAMEAAAAGQFDVVHSHLHVHALVYSALIGCPLVTTLHGVAWNQAHHRLLRRYADRPFVSISHAERAFLPELRYVATVSNGIRVSEFPAGSGNEGHLAFVGRLAPEKAVEWAVETAKRADLPLRIAGPIDQAHSTYYEDVIRPLINHPWVEYVGALTRSEVAALVGGAHGLLMPLRWDEPFGLVVVESLAVGTPVVAWRRGAMPELIDEGHTGFLVDSVEGAVRATKTLDTISRDACRATAQARYSADAMAAGYAAVYEALSVTPSQR